MIHFGIICLTKLFQIIFDYGNKFLSKKYLASAAKLGINIRCVANKSAEVITLEPHYVEGYLKKCRELTSKSCEEACKKMFEEGTLRQGMTVEECTKVSCL